MFQYQKEVIINSTTALASGDGYGATRSRFEAYAPGAYPSGYEGGVLSILRSGEYKQGAIVGGVIHKNVGVVGTLGSAAIDFTALAADAANKPGIYRLSIYVAMDNKFLSDYAYANWYRFGKPIIVQFEVTATDTAAQIAAKATASINEAVPYNNVFLRATTAGAVTTAALTDPYAHIKAVTLEKFEAEDCTCYDGGYVMLADFNDHGKADGTLIAVTINKNQEPFATGQWLIENLRFPTLANLRYNALYQDERPVPGVTYTEYSFAYIMPRDIGGVSVVGQSNHTVTRQIFYVANNVVTDFEAAITAAFGAEVEGPPVIPAVVVTPGA